MKNIILLIVLTMFGCNKDDSSSKKIFIDTHFEFSIQDSEGNDLLNPDMLNYFVHDEIKVFDFENNEKKILDDNGNPNFISNERGYYTIHVNTKSSVFDSESNGEFFTLLQLSNNIVDTIKTEWKSDNGNFYNTRMWYNNKLKWEKDKTELPILITK